MPQKRTTKTLLHFTCPVCGKEFDRWRGDTHGRKVQYCSPECFRSTQRGETHAQWKGGRSINYKGYVLIKVNGVTYLEHRWLWEQAHGPIPRGYVIHHKNEIRHDNRLDNLELMTHLAHQRHHNCAPHWSRSHLCCVRCGTTSIPHGARGLCDRCYERDRWQKRSA